MPKGKTPAGRAATKCRRHHEHSDASESETPYSSDGHISEADEALLDAAIAQNKQAALLATQRALRMKLKEATGASAGTTSSAASAASTDLDASSIADADAFQLEGLEEDLAEEAAMAAEELGIAADEAYLEELETRAAAIRGIASAREWIASAHDAAEALAATAASKAEAAEAAEAAGMDDAAAKADAEEAQLAAEEGRLAEMEATEAAEAAIAGAQARVLAAERRTADARRAAAEAAAAVEEAWIRSGLGRVRHDGAPPGGPVSQTAHDSALAECWVACGAGAYPWLDLCRGAVGASRCWLPSFMITNTDTVPAPVCARCPGRTAAISARRGVRFRPHGHARTLGPR